MKKLNKIMLWSGVVLLSLIIIVSAGFYSVQETAYDYVQNMCTPNFGGAKCVSLSKVVFNADGKDWRALNTPAGSPPSGDIISCPSNANSCEIYIKGSKSVDADIIVHQKVGSSSPPITRIVKRDEAGNQILLDVLLATNEKLEVGYFDTKWLTNAPDYNDPLPAEWKMTYNPLGLDIITEFGERLDTTFSDYGCDFERALMSAKIDSISISETGQNIDYSKDDIVKKTALCGATSCLEGGSVNWVGHWDCGDKLLETSRKIIYNGKEYLCVQGIKGELYTLETLKTTGNTYTYPKSTKSSIPCCPGVTIGGIGVMKTCVQEGNNFFFKEDAPKECISDLSCRQSYMKDVNTRCDGKCSPLGKCDYSSNCRTVECSALKPCTIGKCDPLLNKCVSLDPGDVNPDRNSECKREGGIPFEKEQTIPTFWSTLHLGEPKTVTDFKCLTKMEYYLPYIVLGIFALIAILLITQPKTQQFTQRKR